MLKAEAMAKLTKESLYKKHAITFLAILRLIEANAMQGLSFYTINFTDFPEAKDPNFRLLFTAEGFEFTNYYNESITIVW